MSNYSVMGAGFIDNTDGWYVTRGVDDYLKRSHGIEAIDETSIIVEIDVATVARMAGMGMSRPPWAREIDKQRRQLAKEKAQVEGLADE